jgi:hypothetical protein
MRYEKPEVRDFGSIAEHTYTDHLGDDTDFCGNSIVDAQCVDA